MRQIFVDGVSQLSDWQRLQPDFPWTREGGKKNSVAAEDHILDARHGRDLERYAGLKRSNMARMNAQSFAGLQVAHDEFPGEFEPRRSLSGESLQQEAVAPEDARAQRLLKGDINLYLRSGTEKAVTVNHVFVSWRDFDRHDVARQLSGKGQFTV